MKGFVNCSKFIEAYPKKCIKISGNDKKNVQNHQIHIGGKS